MMQSDWSQGDVLTNGIRMHYYRTGDGSKPPLVLCHGFSDNGECWTPVARALEGDYDIIMIDARGHGLSEAPASRGGPQEQAADLAGLIEALGLERPAVMGHSMGGGATLQLAADYPELVGRAILEDAGPVEFDPSRFDAAMLEQRTAWIRSLKEKSRDEIIALGSEQSPAWSKEELGPWADSKRQLSLEAAMRFTPLSEPWRDLVRRVRCPMLIIRADNDRGAMVTPELAAEAAGINDHIRVVHVPGAGHNVRRENYAAFMAAVRSFLSEE